jgi:hypothetical protein
MDWISSEQKKKPLFSVSRANEINPRETENGQVRLAYFRQLVRRDT